MTKAELEERVGELEGQVQALEGERDELAVQVEALESAPAKPMPEGDAEACLLQMEEIRAGRGEAKQRFADMSAVLYRYFNPPAKTPAVEGSDA